MGSDDSTTARRAGALGRVGLLLTLALGLFGCDHATKLAAEARLAGAPAVPLVEGVLELRYTQNDDTAFSLVRTLGLPHGAGTTTSALLLAASVTALVAIVVTWIATRRRLSVAQHTAFVLVLAGALGNVVDRAMRGYVVDFIHVTRWPVFNVADIAVVAGAALMILAARGRPAPEP